MSELSKELKAAALDAADDAFYTVKNDTPRKYCGASEKTTFVFEDKTYTIEWDGFWEKSEWYDWHITGNDVDAKGTRFLD